MNPTELKKYLISVKPDLIVLQNVTFANAAYASEVMHEYPNVPLLLWTLREPVIDGGRLRLNSLTGAFSAANTIKRIKKEPFEYIFGSPKEVENELNCMIKTAKIYKELKGLKALAIGHTPEGFGFGKANDADLLKTFGIKQIAIEARELMEKAKSYKDEECLEYLEDARSRTVGLDDTKNQNRIDFAKLYKAYKEYISDNEIDLIASRCWPDFFTSYGTPVCAVLAMLNDLGVPAACEGDMYGAITMWLAMKFSNKAVFFGDPVSLDEKENTITFWHCGTAACSLAREDSGAQIGEHCNRHIGPTMEFGCKASEKATITRIGINKDGSYRLLIIDGKALDKPKQFLGTSVVIETINNSRSIIEKCVKDGWEPHYVVAFEYIHNELEMLAHMLNIEVVHY